MGSRGSVCVGAVLASAFGPPVGDAKSPPSWQPELAHFLRTVRHVFVQPALAIPTTADTPSTKRRLLHRCIFLLRAAHHPANLARLPTVGREWVSAEAECGGRDACAEVRVLPRVHGSVDCVQSTGLGSLGGLILEVKQRLCTGRCAVIPRSRQDALLCRRLHQPRHQPFTPKSLWQFMKETKSRMWLLFIVGAVWFEKPLF